MYDKDLIEKIVMDFASAMEEIEAAYRNNPSEVRKNIAHLYAVDKSLNPLVKRIIKGAS